MLQKVLENFKRIDPLLLDLLAYSQDYKLEKDGKPKTLQITALSKAHTAGNRRSINLLL